MANQAMQTETIRSSQATNVGIKVRRAAMPALVIAAAVAASLAVATFDATTTGEAVTQAQAESARWEALVAAEYPGASVGARAESARLTALAAAYASGDVKSPGLAAAQERWEALADSYTRTQRTETARWAGLAAHHTALTPANQAWADRYQGLSNAAG